MERVGTLINKLKEQFEQQAGNDKLAVTAQLLLAELQAAPSRPASTGKVSVMLPKFSVAPVTEDKAAAPVPAIEQKQPEPGKPQPAPFTGEAVTEQPRPVVAGEPQGGEKTAPAASENKPAPEKPVNWMFEVHTEVPTLAHQTETENPAPPHEHIHLEKPVIEFNNRFAGKQGESLNEKLKEEKIEVAHALQGAPIRDLKKAIGINDRFLFVNELFRGDENMYERSIKTINSFSIYAEAQYWIQRELKVKLSWPDTSETVKLFDQLIRRRFS